MAKKSNNIIVLTAHDDDGIIGAGGTLMKYINEKKTVTSVIFSYGEASHIYLKKEVTQDMRKKEWLKVAEYIGIKNTIYLGLEDTKLEKEIKNKDVLSEVMKILKKKRPEKIFTHASDDPHPDHRAVHNVVMEAYDKLRLKSDLYSFDVWTPFKVSKKERPVLYIDISDTFTRKIKAFRMFKSQWSTFFTLIAPLFIKTYLNGWKNNCRYAEKLYKER